jgi:hypothetical protein
MDMKITGIISMGLFMAVALALVGACAASQASVSENRSDESYIGHTLHSWRGFAINDDESHVLRISIESKMSLDPVQVRELLDSNASIDEIHSQVGNEGGEVTNKGYLRIGKEMIVPESALKGDQRKTAGKQGTYELVNMKMTPSKDFTAVESDVADLGYSEHNSTAKIVGHLFLNATDLGLSRTSEVTEGQLTMNGGPLPGSYKVLLETQSHLATFTGASGDSGLPDVEYIQDGASLQSMKAVRSAGIGPENIATEKIMIVKKDPSRSPMDAMLSDGLGSEKIVVIKKDYQ